MSLEYEHVPMIFLALILVYGIYRTFIFPSMYERQQSMQQKISSNELANIMLKRAGLSISGREYYLITFAIGGLVLLICTLAAAKRANIGIFLLGCIFGGGIIWALRPVEIIYGKLTSPFAAIIKSLTKSRQKKFDNEIYGSCIILKNLSIVQQEKPLSADYMFEQLARNSKELKPIYATMISMYRTGQAEKAFQVFGATIGTSNGKTFAGLLSKLDKINPVELKEQVIAIQETMAEKKQTEGYKKAQRNGMITMAISTAAVMAVILDFLVVVVLTDVMNMMVF